MKSAEVRTLSTHTGRRPKPLGDEDLADLETGSFAAPATSPTPANMAAVSSPETSNPFHLENPGILDIAPPEPKTLEETGLKLSLLADIGLKFLYYQGSGTGVEIASEMRLPWAAVVERVLEFLIAEKLVDLRGGK